MRTPISTWTRLTRNSGFTLIELLVVIALIALVTVFAAPSISRSLRISLNSASRELASTVKETYNSAVVTGKVHRVVYDLKNNQFWVERGPATALLDTAESKEREDRAKRLSRGSEEKEPPAPAFALDKTITRKKISLPRGVRFEDVITQQSTDPVIEGMAYTHIFSHGLAEQTIIHLTDDSKRKISLVITPLVGRTELYERYVTQEEAFGK